VRKYYFVLLIIIFGFFASSCEESEIPVVDNKITLIDLAGKIEEEILALYANEDLTITFSTLETNDYSENEFVRYIGYSIGDQVDPGIEISIEIAIPLITSFILEDLSGKTQAEISAIYADTDVTITFVLTKTNDVAPGLFVSYVGYQFGDEVDFGETITIQIAEPLVLKFTLPDLVGMTQTEIEVLFADVDLVITYREVSSSEVPAGQFIKYGGFSAGNEVSFGTNIRIDIAVLAPSAPTISGADDETIYAAVTGNPPTFDIFDGVHAYDYLGNEIPLGGFFFILKIEDSASNIIEAVDYYRVGDYTIYYQAINSLLTTTVERVIHIVIPPFDTDQTDALRLDVTYTGLSFIDDGIGEVEITSFTDADTTNFVDVVSGDKFTVRYLGIDAPEATSKYDPWGIKAANFVREILTNADKIILQAEGDRTDGNGRYLAWVWYIVDGETRLLNLEIVEQAYAWVSGATTTQYATPFEIAGAETQLTGKRIYGEIDPDYDYSTEGTPIEIGILIDTFDDYLARKVTVTGIITSKVGNSIYLEQNGRGIYIYTGYNPTNELQIGYEVTIQGLVGAVYYEGKQLSDYKYENMQLESIDNPVVITTIMGNQIGNYVGRVVNFENLTIQSIDPSDTNNAYTIIAKDDLNNTVNIRVDDYTASFAPSYLFVSGAHISVFGPVTQFYSTYQLMLPGLGNIEFKD